MKKTLQECKEIIASENKWKDFNEIIAYASNMDLLSLTDLANKMYYEQSEDESFKAENEELKQLLSDAITMFELIKKFKMILPTNP